MGSGANETTLPDALTSGAAGRLVSTTEPCGPACRLWSNSLQVVKCKCDGSEHLLLHMHDSKSEAVLCCAWLPQPFQLWHNIQYPLWFPHATKPM